MTTTAIYRSCLPQMGDDLFITDAGLETTLIFHEKVDLPCFAAFTMLATSEGRSILRRYFDTYMGLARTYDVGVVLESATWRANPDWGARLGFDRQGLRDINHEAIRMLEEIRSDHGGARMPIVISGNLGPRGDGYSTAKHMSIHEAREYHEPQVRDFTETAADMVAAFTMNYHEEAAGVVLAAKDAGMPVAISFTLETDGRLPSGEALGNAIETVDDITDGYAAYYMINCAHPTHFYDTLSSAGTWIGRLRGLRANASRKSHKELDESTELDSGDPWDLGQQYRKLGSTWPSLRVIGGCCGTDHRHVEVICRSLQRANHVH